MLTDLRVTEGQNPISNPAHLIHTPMLFDPKHVLSTKRPAGGTAHPFSSGDKSVFTRTVDQASQPRTESLAWVRGFCPTSVAWELRERTIKLKRSQKKEEGGTLVAESRKGRFQFA